MMTIGDVIEELHKAKPKAFVIFDFCEFSPWDVDSWRGIYAHPALSHISSPNPIQASALIETLEESLTYDHTGYKGGEFRFTRDCPLHVDNYGECTHTEIARIEVDNDYPRVIIHTRHEEPY